LGQPFMLAIWIRFPQVSSKTAVVIEEGLRAKIV
jgi:hypothetical protein